MRDDHGGVEDAASYARDATVNFNRRGYLMPYLNAAFMFSNASIQGLGRAFKSMRSDCGKRTVALLFLVGLVQSLLDHYLGRDEEREEKGLSSARNLSEHEKQSSLGVPLPGGLRLKTQIRNPWALPMYAGRKAGELITGWTDGRTAAADLNRTVATVKDARLAMQGAKPEQVLRDVPFVRDTLTNLPDVSSRYYGELRDYEADRLEYRGLAETDDEKTDAFAESHPWTVMRENPLVDYVKELGKAGQEAETPSEAAELRRERLAAMAEFVRRMEEEREAVKQERKVSKQRLFSHCARWLMRTTEKRRFRPDAVYTTWHFRSSQSAERRMC